MKKLNAIFMIFLVLWFIFPGLVLAQLPSRWDWREHNGVTPVKNQGGCGSCWAFATVATTESAILINEGTYDVSEQHLVSCNTEGWGCSGGEEAFQYYYDRQDECSLIGTVQESCFPYTARDDPCDCCDCPRIHNLSNWGYIAGSRHATPTDQQMKEYIYNYGPIFAAVDCNNWDLLALEDGVVKEKDFKNGVQGVNHAITIVGWDDDYQGSGTGIWIIKNSWGDSWQHGGYGYVEYESGQIGYGACWVEYTGSGYPDITVSPSRFDVTVPAGSSTTRMLTIGNVGERDLHFNISRSYSSQPGEEVLTGSGGPDAYGYHWIDSDEAGGPTYNWVEISGVGTEITLGDDAYQEIDLPFAFDFYGVNKTSVKISSNGYLTFGTDGTDFSNDPIPSNTNPDDFIAPFWDDLNPGSGAQGHIYYYYDESNSRFIVEYKEVQHYSSGRPETFEVILYQNGDILYQYQALSYVTSSTVGIENSDASTGLQVVYNSSYLHNELAIRISSGVDWLSFEPDSGTVAPGGSSDVTVTFNAAELTEGTYEANIFVNSNDPDESQVVIPVTLHVGFTPPPEAKPMPWLFLLLD